MLEKYKWVEFERIKTNQVLMNEKCYCYFKFDNNYYQYVFR